MKPRTYYFLCGCYTDEKGNHINKDCNSTSHISASKPIGTGFIYPCGCRTNTNKDFEVRNENCKIDHKY